MNQRDHVVLPIITFRATFRGTIATSALLGGGLRKLVGDT
jgi:hypothetical protein